MAEVSRAEAERFGRVWQRVNPSGSAPILPVPPEEAVGAASLPAEVLGRERQVQREAQALWRHTGFPGFGQLVEASVGRSRRTASAVFLGSGTKPVPGSGAPSQPGGLSGLYRALLLTEDAYRALSERTPDPVLVALYTSLAADCRRDRGRVVSLVTGWNG